MKRRIFLVCLLYCFLRLQIYESIAAIFWQSAGYVYIILFYVFYYIVFNMVEAKSAAHFQQSSKLS